MTSHRVTARLVGVFFILATGLAIAGDLLLRPLRDDADFLSAYADQDGRVLFAVLTELGLVASVVAIAALLFPLLKHQHEGLAVGYVGARVIEGVVVLMGAMTSLLLLTVSRDYVDSAAAERSGFQPLGDLLLEARDWTDPLATVLVFGVSAAILYPLLIAGVMRLYGESASSTLSVLFTAPLGLNEMVLAAWLLIKGFNESSLVSTPTTQTTPIEEAAT